MSATADLRVAVLGVGTMGSFHTELLSTRVRGARVTVVTDFDQDRAEAVAAPVGARVVVDPFDAIAGDDVDAVVIATPGSAHEKQVLACLERGLPVLCEKPLTMDCETAYEIVQAEHALGRSLVQVGFMRRFDPEYAQLRELIASGGLGNPLLVHCAHRNRDVPAFFTTAMAVTDSVVHEVDVVRFLLDEEIVAVTVLQPSASARAPAGVSDPLMVLFETASGRIADVEAFCRTGVAYEVRTEVVGDAGSAMIGLDTGLVRTSAGATRSAQIAPGFVQRFALAYANELQSWAEAAQLGTVAGPGSWDGYAALAVCRAGVESVRTGGRVEVILAARP